MKLSRWIRFAVPLFAAMALAWGLVSCGGGGGGIAAGRPAVQANSTLAGEQEVPPLVSGGIGSGSLTLDGSNNLSGSMTVDGITPTSVGIHQGAVGAVGPLIVPLVQTTPGTWSVPAGTMLTDDQRDALINGGLYFEADTDANPGGELRGQIGNDVFLVLLTGGQEVPPTPSTAVGAGRLTLDPVTHRFSATVITSGITGIAAHIHQGAPGVSGPILFPLTETPAGSGTWVAAGDAVMTDDQVAAMKAGQFYFNVHSAAFPNGEIRGQIALIVGDAFLIGAFETPPTPSTARGTGTLVVDPATRAIVSGVLTVTGMQDIAAHIHIGAPGVPGPIIQPLANTAPGVWTAPAGATLSADNFAALKRGDLYYNAHSPTFPNGEIRGQIR